MNVAAITRYKQGDIYRLLKKLGWSQNELARRTGIHQTQLGLFINLRRRPSVKAANKIQAAFGEAGEYLDVLAAWPETFQGFKRAVVTEQIQDVSEKQLLALNGPTINMLEARAEGLDRALATLSPREQGVLKLRYKEGKTYEDIGKTFGVGVEQIRHDEAKALRKLRHPAKLSLIAGRRVTSAEALTKKSCDL